MQVGAIDTKLLKRNPVGGPLWILLIAYSATALLLGSALTVSLTVDIPIEKLTADPAASADFHPFTGIISNLGALLWCTAMISCFFAYLVKRKVTWKNDLFLLYSSILSGVLLIDDMFMLHEFVFPYNLKIEQEIVYAAYLFPVLTYLIHFRKVLLNFEPAIIFTAFLFLGSSVLGDQVMPQEGYYYFIEDGLKFIGIITWSIYYLRISVHRVLLSFSIPRNDLRYLKKDYRKSSENISVS